MRIVGCLLFTALAAAAEIPLQAPLTTIVRATGPLPPGGKAVSARVTVPADAPVDLGVGAFLADAHGRWFQSMRPGLLKPGVQRVRIELGVDTPAGGTGAVWNAAQADLTARGGLFLWSASASRAVVLVDDLRVEALAPDADGGPTLSEVATGGAGRTGERWQLTCRPQPFPRNPYDPEEFALDLVVTAPSGGEQRIPGFAELPMRGHDRGDREEVEPDGRERFTARFRPREPGLHRMRLEGRWGARDVATELAPLVVAGARWDGYVRVDRGDPRFLALDGKPFWPIGPNLRAVTDPRCTERMGTRVTPDRGTLAYDAFLARLAPSGATAAELWLSSWNLALEWRGDWPEYHGVGRYSQERAWRFDRILDQAWSRGLRFNVVINNHGQASDEVDREWHNSPYSREGGGFLDNAIEWFRDPRALAKQDHLRRYLAARYADHPAIMGWKLLSEQDLTAAGRRRDVDLLAKWQTDASARWKILDTYGHPITTHWAGSWRSVYPAVAALPGIDYLTIDAYHDTFQGGKGELLAELLAGSSARRGSLSRFGKPILVTEFGGQWSACPEPQMIAEHASSGFCALVSGQAGAPMIWWFEWVDQTGRFAPYRALGAFIADEDQRHPQAQSLPLQAEDSRAPGAPFWCRAWSRPGRLLGYLLDEPWQATGEDTPPREATVVTIGEEITPGGMTVSWWDADAGREVSRVDIDHPGGPLRLTSPAWRHHLAFKLWRR